MDTQHATSPQRAAVPPRPRDAGSFLPIDLARGWIAAVVIAPCIVAVIVLFDQGSVSSSWQWAWPAITVTTGCAALAATVIGLPIGIAISRNARLAARTTVVLALFAAGGATAVLVPVVWLGGIASIASWWAPILIAAVSAAIGGAAMLASAHVRNDARRAAVHGRRKML